MFGQHLQQLNRQGNFLQKPLYFQTENVIVQMASLLNQTTHQLNRFHVALVCPKHCAIQLHQHMACADLKLFAHHNLQVNVDLNLLLY